MSAKDWFINLCPALVGLIGNSLNVLVTLSLNLAAVPQGTSIRPMVYAAWILIIAMGTFVLGVALATINIKRGRSKLLALGGLLPCLTPYPLAIVVFVHYMEQYGLILSE